MVATESAGTHAVNDRDTAVPRGVHRDDVTSGGVGDLSAVEQLLDRAETMEWRAPELAAILGERAASLAEAAGANALWVRAEATVVHAHVLLGHRASTVGRAVAALRAAEDAELPVIAAQVRTDLAVCARSVGAPLTGLAILRPVLTVSGLSTVRRATALCHLVGCLGTLGRKAELDRVLLEGDRLVAGDATLDEDDKLMARGMIRLGVSAHRRRHGDTMGAADAARTGIGFLDRMEDPARDGGVARVRLVLELVCSLLDRGDGEPALEAAQSLFDQPERAAAVAPTAWLRAALATRVLLSNGAAESAATMLRDALYGVVRHDLDAVVARLWLELANVEERIGNAAEAVTCLHNARAAEQRYARARSQARAVLHGEFGSGEQAPVDLAEIVTSARPQQTPSAPVAAAEPEPARPAPSQVAVGAEHAGAANGTPVAGHPTQRNGSGLAGGTAVNGHQPVNGHGAKPRNGAAVAGDAASTAGTASSASSDGTTAADDRRSTHEPAETAAEATMVMPAIPRSDGPPRDRSTTAESAAPTAMRTDPADTAPTDTASADTAPAETAQAHTASPGTEQQVTEQQVTEQRAAERAASAPTRTDDAAAGAEPTDGAATADTSSGEAASVGGDVAPDGSTAAAADTASEQSAERGSPRKRRRHDVEHGSITARSVLDRLGISPSRGGRRHAAASDTPEVDGSGEAASHRVPDAASPVAGSPPERTVPGTAAYSSASAGSGMSGLPSAAETDALAARTAELDAATSRSTESAASDVLDSGTAGASVEPILAAATASAPQLDDSTAIISAVTDETTAAPSHVETAGSDMRGAPGGHSGNDPNTTDHNTTDRSITDHNTTDRSIAGPSTTHHAMPDGGAPGVGATHHGAAEHGVTDRRAGECADVGYGAFGAIAETGGSDSGFGAAHESVADPWLPRVKLPPPLLPIEAFTSGGDPDSGEGAAAAEPERAATADAEADLPATRASSAPEPAAPEPAAPEPAGSEPSRSEPAASEPATPESATPESANPESAALSSAVSEPSRWEPSRWEPSRWDPSVSDSDVGEPAVSDTAAGVPDLPRHELPLDEPPEDAGLAELLARALAEHQVASGAALASTPSGEDREGHAVGSGVGVNGSRRNGSTHARGRGGRHDR
ncbi:hypothetical protein [Prauserella alba]|uniref:Uncharacterized protein n=1 Tax=Prauserella alba TaxID=176898 RepID=A0ABP4GDC7_9PSEU|nr:hypothetical protein [Prauserella alba]MCP2180643.1 hypothetical protein [Prauserella alba]